MSEHLERWLAYLVGLALAAATVVGTRLADVPAPPGADVTFVANPSAELEVRPTGPVLAVPNLRPGAAAARNSTLDLRNQTGTPGTVRLRALPSTRELDRPLSIRLSADGRMLYDGRLDGLRSWTAVPLRLGPGVTATLKLAVSIPRSARGWQGRMATVSVEFALLPEAPGATAEDGAATVSTEAPG